MRLWHWVLPGIVPGRSLRRIAVAILGLGLAGAAEGPRGAQGGEVNTARTSVSAWAEEAPATAVRESAGIPDGLTLRDVLNLAAEHNPTFDQFSANLARARAEILAALAYPNPEIEGSIGRVETREEPIENAAEYGLSIEQVIELPHKRRARREAAEAGIPVAELEEDEFRAALRSEVAKAFHLVGYQMRAVGLARDGAALTEEIEAIVQRRLEAGEIAEIDLIKARIERLKSSRKVQVELRKLSAARRALNLLCGGSLRAQFSVLDEFEATAESGIESVAAAERVKNHPSLKRLEALIVKQQQTLESEKVAWHPDLRPGVSLGREMDADTFSFSLGVEIPLWNRNRGGIASADAELDRLRGEYEAMRLELKSTLEGSAEAYALAIQQLKGFDAALLEGAAEALAIETLLYQHGEHDLLQLLDARRTAQEVEVEFLQSQYDAAIAHVEFERALGIGGHSE